MNEGRVIKYSQLIPDKEKKVRADAVIPKSWLKDIENYSGGKSEYVRDAIFNFRTNRHIIKFREILEGISGELLFLSAWKEKGHPAGLKWTEELEMMLAYYEKCFDVLMNSPFNDELE